MRQDEAEDFERWFKRQRDAGLGVTDEFEIGVVMAVAKAAFEYGKRHRKLRQNASSKLKQS